MADGILYCVKTETGHLVFTSLATTAEESIKEFMDIESGCLSIFNLAMRAQGKPGKSYPTWEQYLKDGYSVVAVELREII